jgi:hypothetical protein
MNCRQRRNAKFKEELIKNNCNTNAELKNKKNEVDGKVIRKHSLSLVNRHKRREKQWWEIAKRNDARKEETKRRHEFVRISKDKQERPWLYPKEIPPNDFDEPTPIDAKPSGIVEWKLRPIDINKKSKNASMLAPWITGLDPRNILIHAPDKIKETERETKITTFVNEEDWEVKNRLVEQALKNIEQIPYESKHREDEETIELMEDLHGDILELHATDDIF